MTTHLLILLLVPNSTLCQTNISGGIYANTTWTAANSPYIVVDTVVVFDGIELTIEPGVTISFHDSTILEVRGRVYAIGTLSDSIVFTSASTSPYPGIYQGVWYTEIDTGAFHYCKFEYAKYALYHGNVPKSISHCLFTNNLFGEFGDGPIDHCEFRNNQRGVWASYNSSIRNSTFVGNDQGISACYENVISDNIFCNNRIGIWAMQRDSIYDNVILWNDTGIFVDASLPMDIRRNIIAHNEVGIERWTNSPQNEVYTDNTICFNHFSNFRTNATFNLDVTNNCWCSAEPETIGTGIYDGYDDITIGLVLFEPYNQCDPNSIPNPPSCVANWTGVESVIPALISVTVYPNPSWDVTMVEMEGFYPKDFNVLVIDQLGRTVRKMTNINSPRFRIEHGDLSPGQYVLHIFADEHLPCSRKLILY